MLSRVRNENSGDTKTLEKHGSRALTRMDANALPPNHPASLINQIYKREMLELPPQHLPSLEGLAAGLGSHLLNYCIVLSPREADPFIDFVVEHCGAKTAGPVTTAYAIGDLYTDRVLPFFANERLMEFTACLSLKCCRFSRTLSARPSSLNVRIFRAVFPVWSEILGRHAILLAVAPVHVELPSIRPSPH